MKKVLLVEDDDMMLRMYKKVFTFGGFEVIVAENGEDGLARAKETKPDLIILDVMMPKMNGLELLDKLKDDPKLKQIPTVMLTNLGMDHEIKKALDRGALLYLIKNEHDPKKVFEMVKELI
jgi:CheY-like chemotaxis protein